MTTLKEATSSTLATPLVDVSGRSTGLVYGSLKDYKQVIFHCHLSQQRGPKAAGQYAQARQAALEEGKFERGGGKAGGACFEGRV